MIHLFSKTKKAEKIARERKAGIKDWMPVSEIQPHTIKLKNGEYVSFLRVTPINISLKSETEKQRIIALLHGFFNGLIEKIQIISIGLPIDLDTYISNLATRSEAETSPIKKKLLKDYTRYASSLVTGGSAQEQRFYILLTRDDPNSCIAAAQEMSSALTGVGLTTRVCDCQEISDLYFGFFNPDKLDTEEPVLPGVSLPPQYNKKSHR